MKADKKIEEKIYRLLGDGNCGNVSTILASQLTYTDIREVGSLYLRALILSQQTYASTATGPGSNQQSIKSNNMVEIELEKLAKSRKLDVKCSRDLLKHLIRVVESKLSQSQPITTSSHTNFTIVVFSIPDSCFDYVTLPASSKSFGGK